MELSFRVSGMTCLDCARAVERAMTRVPGVEAAEVHYLRRAATVKTRGDVDVQAVLAAVREAGYRAEPA